MIEKYISKETITKARRHLALEWGHKRSRKAVAHLHRQLKALDRQAHKRGERIEVRTHLTTSPRLWSESYGLGVEVWGITADGQRIVWDIRLFCDGSPYSSGYEYTVVNAGRHGKVLRAATRADQLIRAAIRTKEIYQEEQRQERLSQLTEADREVADQLRPILGAAHEGHGWVAKEGGWLHTTHDYALKAAPDYRDRLREAGWTVDPAALSSLSLGQSTERWQRA